MKFASSIDELIDLDDIRGLSGLELLQGVRDGKFAAPPICRPINYELYSVEPGRVVFRGTPKFDHLNPLRGVHGGWYGTVLDSCMSCAVHTLLPPGRTYTTLEYKINITRAIPVGSLVEAIGWVDHSGRSTGVASGEIRGVEDGKLYATGTATCLSMDLP